MQLMDQALLDAITAKLVDPDDAYRYANDRKKFERFVTDTTRAPESERRRRLTREVDCDVD